VATKNFNVKNGITTGNITLDAATSNANVGNLNSAGRVYATDNLLIGSTGGEGGQLTIGYTGINGITGQANSTWNVDVDGSNNFRIFTQYANGAASTPTTFYSANNNINFPANVSAGYFIGNGSQLTGIVAAAGASIVNGNSNVTVVANSNVTVSVAGTANTVVFSTSGITSNGANAFLATGSAYNNVALGMLSANASNGANMAIRDFSSVTSTMYFDVAVGGTANGSFLFRTNSGFSSLATISNAGLTLSTGVFNGNGNSLSSLQGANVLGTVANATNAAAVQTNTSASSTVYLAGVTSSSNGNSALNIVTGITANFAANSITATTFNGSLANGNSNVSIAANGNVNISAVGNPNVLAITGTGANLVGTLNIGGRSLSQSAWTTGGIALVQSAATYTDTTSAAGTVADVRINQFNAPTLAASNAITVTNLYGTYFTAPVSGTNVTASANYAVAADSAYVNGTFRVQGSTLLAVNTTTGTFGVGSSIMTGTITLGSATGTQTTNIQAGATTSGNTKTINMGTGGVSGSTTTIIIGSANGTTTTINGNANIGNVGTAQVLASANVTAPQLISNVATGTAPFVVTSTTQVANLNVATAGTATTATNAAAVLQNVQTTGTYYPAFISSTANGNYSLNSNTAFSANVSNGAMIATTFAGNIQGGTGNSNVGNIGATNGAFTGNVTAGNANVTGQIISTIGTGTAPFVVTSTSKVANLSVETANTATTAATAGSASTAGTVTTAAQPNITSVGTLTSLNTGAISTSANLNLNSNYINNVATPSANSDAATKGYVDGLVSTGLYYHAAVNAATTTTLATTTGGTITYNNGTAGVNANLVTTGSFNLIDTANVQTVGTRILVKDEANAAWNGVYTWANATTIVRSTDTDSYGPGTGDLSENDYFFVNGGSVNIGTSYVCNTAGTIVFGTTNITFSLFSTSQVYSNGTGLGLSGTVFSISNTSVTAGTYGNSDAVATFTVNNQGQLTAASNTVIQANAANLSGTVLKSTVVTSSLTSVGTVTTGVWNNNIGTSATFAAGLSGANLASITGANVTGTVPNATAATNASALLQNTSTATTVYPIFTTSSANGNASAVINTSISANLGNASITATTFVGALSGAHNGTVGATTANTGAFTTISATGQITSTVATSTAPFVVSSNTLVANLNADLLDGFNSATAATASTIALRDANGNVSANYFTGILANGNSNVSIAANANITLSAAGSGTLIVTGTGANVFGYATATGNVTGANIVATQNHIFSVATGIAAAGSSQGAATGLTKDINQVTSVTPTTADGVSLPTAVPGYRITILNASLSPLNVYPLGNGTINGGTANAAYSQPAGARLDFICIASTVAPGGRWFTMNATYG
jgi:hypothetical protein